MLSAEAGGIIRRGVGATCAFLYRFNVHDDGSREQLTSSLLNKPQRVEFSSLFVAWIYSVGFS